MDNLDDFQTRKVFDLVVRQHPDFKVIHNEWIGWAGQERSSTWATEKMLV